MKIPVSNPIESLPALALTLAPNISVNPEDDPVPWMRGWPNTGDPIADFMDSAAAFAEKHQNPDAALFELLQSTN